MHETILNNSAYFPTTEDSCVNRRVLVMETETGRLSPARLGPSAGGN